MTATSKPWLSHYQPGVPANIDASVYPSLVELLEQAFKQHARRDAAAFMGARWTFEQLDDASKALAGWLQSCGLAPGARVALMMPNVPQYMVAIAAVLRAGYVVVNVNPLYTPRELEHQLKDSGAEAIVILENFAVTLQQVVKRTPVKHVVLAAMGDMLPWAKGKLVNFVVRHAKKMVPAFTLPAGLKVTKFNDALDQGRGKASFKRPQLRPDDVAFLQYTGGTTGVSKGATLLHRNVVANILQCEAWFKPELDKNGNEQLVNVCALPLYHIFALTAGFMVGARMGSLNILIANPRDIDGFIKTLKGFRVSQFPAVNTLYNGLVNHPEFAKLDFSGLRVCNGGGMAVQQATAEKWKKITGCSIVEGYGLSETSPVATINRLDSAGFTGAIGMPISSTEVVILDDDGTVLGTDEVGEIAIRGPQVMAGYWNRPDETAKVMTADGFFRTGDMGIMNADGLIKIVDRKKDMILVSGFNVYPNEVEQVVNLHPGVLECAAVGVADAKSGEAVKLFVVKKDPSLVEEDLVRYCKEQLTGYKCPKYIEFRHDLPKTNVGKILRRELRDEHKKAA
ncbi:long-chain fatty acid--CoA ligase (plasmid) [Aquabacterium olei]|uniref:Long-chain-fatty-acid--CoA ligase n=1 Tax=Aquabacterium olei TaxID=1296669 RepID=A0A2U8FYZ2_9BURK|nr:long-chain-fatty-acid--CoA ligase [Aquabacterium olei]AWI55624.1 long-chain fatty acid--CoA ligase [Aquabacterium olei]